MRVREAYLKYRASEVEIPSRVLSTPEDVYEAYKHLNDQPVEAVIAVFVDARNKVMCQSTLQTGTVDHSVIYPREVFVRALLVHASGILIIHNHPAGDPTPSPQDIHLTEGLSQGARALGIRLLDHMIVGDGQCFSFRQSGLLS
jgi:DNA repair protein RadC